MEPSSDFRNSNLINIHFEQNRQRQGLTWSAENIDDPPRQQSATVELVTGAGIDKSRKGGVDSKIFTLVQHLNNLNGDFFTTSSCSGRAILFTHDSADSSDSEALDSANELGLDLENPAVQSPSKAPTRKKGCKWLYVSHDEVQLEEFLKAWKDVPSGTNVVFKMEPCVLHIQCRDLACSRKLIHVATQSGFRNSGMVIGKDNKMTVAIRSAIGLEVPLMKEKQGDPPIVPSEYLSYLVSTANAKLVENWKRTEILEAGFCKQFHLPKEI